jgi:hypothetical protein
MARRQSARMVAQTSADDAEAQLVDKVDGIPWCRKA